jgi:hypothetical protein
MMFFFQHSQVQAPSSSKYLGDLEKVLERIIAYIDSLRTLHWQRDPNRKPAVLPVSIQLKSLPILINFTKTSLALGEDIYGPKIFFSTQLLNPRYLGYIEIPPLVASLPCTRYSEPR